MTYKARQIIREIATGTPFEVIHSYKGATLVADKTQRSPVTARVILERDYDKYADEHMMIAKEKKRQSYCDETIVTWGMLAL